MQKNEPVLLEAHNIISVDRQEAYGDPGIGFKNVATQWALFMSQKYGVHVPLVAEDICWMMADLKKVRQMNAAKRDNVVDAAGYLGLIERL